MDGLKGLTNDGFIDKLRDIVTPVAPLLGTLLGNGFGGVVVGLLANCFGIDSKKPAELLAKVRENPNAVAELQDKHEELLEQLSLQIYQSESDDRKNARDRQLTLPHDFVPSILAVGFLIIYTVVQVYCVRNEMVNDMISARIQDIMMLIIGYYFGNTHKKSLI